MGGYVSATRHELERRLLLTRIPIEQVEAAFAFVSLPDPALVLQHVTLEDVMRVALHMNPVLGGQVFFSPFWEAIIRRHAAARAIVWHELCEIAAFGQLGVTEPGLLTRSDRVFLSAHALASWREAEYWERWAASESDSIYAASFLLAHPLRMPSEIEAIRRVLRRDWSIGVPVPDPLELDRALRYFASKDLSWTKLP